MTHGEIITLAERERPKRGHCEGCSRAAENYLRLREEYERLLRALRREADHHWDKRASHTGPVPRSR